METKMFTKVLVPSSATHPGLLLRDELEYRAIDQKELAGWMNMEHIDLTVVLDGDKHITAEFAMKLEQMLGVDAYYWMRMQAKYDIDVLRMREWESKPSLLSDELSGSAGIISEPKSTYANLGARLAAAN